MKTILIVDDRVDNRAVLIAMLAHRGYRLIEAESGEQALQLTRSEKPDLVIADVLMPRMDGYEFVRQLRDDPEIAKTPVIFYTASYIEEESRKLAEACGVNQVIVKPAEPEDVFKAVDAALGADKPASATAASPEFVHAHLHLVTDKLAEKVQELENLNEKLELEINERKRAEEQLREQADIVNRTQDAIIVRDFTSDRITVWNRGAEHLYGWVASETIGRPMRELVYADSNERDAILQQLAATGEFHGEVKHRAKDGREVIVDARVTLIRSDDGAPRSVLGINTDITERKKLEMQLLRAQRLESIGTLASGVAHDLNNILAPIMMGAAVLRRTERRPDDEAILSTIETCAQRGADVVKQVLAFARGVEGERVTLNPPHLIEEIVDIAKQTFPKSIRIVGSYPEDLWPIEGDPTQLHQVLLNLSVNARDAMPVGGTLALSAENFPVDEHYATMTPGAKPGPHVRFEVTDTGMGIPPQNIDKIFDPFFSTKELSHGTGLGLSSVIGIVKSHGGFMSVYSEIGRGSTFKVYLPAKIGELQTSKASGTTVLPPAQGELLLLVDDEKPILQVARALLEGHGYRILTAEDATDALAIFAIRKEEVKLVLTDLSMPLMDGIALIRTLKKMKPDVRVIASTGRGGLEQHAHELASLKVRSCLTKPYNKSELLTALHDALHHQENKP